MSLGRMIAAAPLLLAVAFPVAAVAEERYAVVIAGVSGGEKYAEQQARWRTELAAFLATNFAFPDANIVTLGEESQGSARATAENLRAVFADLRRRVAADDVLMVILLGHGTYDGTDAKFNLVGPDLSAAEWNALLDGIAGRMVIVNTTAASFPFLAELSRRGRVVITATDSAAQRFATVFPEYFIRALADRSSDFDKNGRVSVWEAFAATSAAVRQHYEQRGQLATERPLLDDNGDGIGVEAGAPGDDGATARAVYLDAPSRARDADSGEAVEALERRHVELERQLEALKGRRESMSEEEYQAELERILVELARIAQQIRQRS